MSGSIKLKHASGNGVIISAPSSNPAADRTLELPSDADVTMVFEGKCFELKFSIIPQDKDDRKYYKSLGFEYDYKD